MIDQFRVAAMATVMTLVAIASILWIGTATHHLRWITKGEIDAIDHLMEEQRAQPRKLPRCDELVA